MGVVVSRGGSVDTVGAQARRATVHKPWLCTFHLGGDLERFQTTETS